MMKNYRWSKYSPVPVEDDQTKYTVPLYRSVSDDFSFESMIMSSDGDVICTVIKLAHNHRSVSVLYRDSGVVDYMMYETPVKETVIAAVNKEQQQTGCRSMVIPIVLGGFLALEIALLLAGIGVLVKYGGHIPEPTLYVRDITHSSYLKFSLSELEALPFDKYGWYHFAIQDHLGMVNVIPVAYGPVASAVVPESEIYVVSGISKAVSVVDINQNKVIWTILLTSTPSYVAISPDGKYAWVLSPFDNITVIEVATRTVVALLSLGSNVELKKIIFSFDGGLAWIVGGNRTSVIDTATYKVKNTPIGVGRQSEDIALTFDGQWALVPSRMDNLIAVINAKEEEPKRSYITAGVGNEPWCIVSSSHKWVFVTNYASDTVSVIDTDKIEICANISVPDQPYQLLISPDGHRVYGLSKQGQAVFVIKVATENFGCSENQLIATLSVPTTPYAMAITSDGSRVIVTHEWVPGRGGGITIVDTANVEDRSMKRTKTIWITESELGEPVLVSQ
jgi:YVTN family beta-propeller protein